jgi:hypothetical protein
MSLILLSVVINGCTFVENKWVVNYTLTSLSSNSIFLVQDRHQPFLRMVPDETLLEIWLGIPPQTEAEKNQLMNALILPETFEFTPGSSINRTAVINYPLKESGYWLEQSKETTIPLKGKTEIKAQIIQGFGIIEMAHQRIRNIDALYAWQMTARSQVVVFKFPSVHF